MILYQYCSPLVIGAAIGLFLTMIRIKNLHKSRLIKLLADASLTTYLVHMHPIIKNCYVQWNILGWVEVYDPILMVLQTVGLIILIWITGVLLSVPINKLAAWFVNKVMKNISNRK